MNISKKINIKKAFIIATTLVMLDLVLVWAFNEDDSTSKAQVKDPYAGLIQVIFRGQILIPFLVGQKASLIHLMNNTIITPVIFIHAENQIIGLTPSNYNKFRPSMTDNEWALVPEIQALPFAQKNSSILKKESYEINY